MSDKESQDFKISTDEIISQGAQHVLRPLVREWMQRKAAEGYSAVEVAGMSLEVINTINDHDTTIVRVTAEFEKEETP